ncbi:MAG: hypothetical protein WC829_00450 [Hyphomicrobium sp.]|jgi:hypothetical protein
MTTKTTRTILATWALVMAYFVFADHTPGGTLMARSDNCFIAADAYGHYYGGGYAGSRNFSNWYTATNNVDCAANWGQNVAISNGSAACDIYGLNGGVGYVLLSWDWYFTGSPTSNGHLNQQYDCDDI